MCYNIIYTNLIKHFRSISATCQSMTRDGGNTECYDNDGNVPGVCQCLVGYINETDMTTNTHCKGLYLICFTSESF